LLYSQSFINVIFGLTKSHLIKSVLQVPSSQEGEQLLRLRVIRAKIFQLMLILKRIVGFHYNYNI